MGSRAIFRVYICLFVGTVFWALLRSLDGIHVLGLARPMDSTSSEPPPYAELWATLPVLAAADGLPAKVWEELGQTTVDAQDTRATSWMDIGPLMAILL